MFMFLAATEETQGQEKYQWKDVPPPEFFWSERGAVLTDQVGEEQVVNLLSDPRHQQQTADH